MIEKIQEVMKNYEPKLYAKRIEAAVFIPLIKVAEEWHILYEVRSELVSQAGDSSFPGGRIEEGETFEEAAIRETMEELNLTRENIEVFGEMDILINQNVYIHSFVGQLVDVAFQDIQPNEEVAELYTIPLSYLLKNKPSYFSINFDPIIEEQFLEKADNNLERYKLKTLKEKVPYYEFNSHLLWGITANLTDRLIEIIKEKVFCL